MQNSLINKDLDTVAIREDAGKERNFRHEKFVFNVGVPTLMDMERCMSSMDSPAQNSLGVLMNDVFFLSHDFTCNERAGERKGR